MRFKKYRGKRRKPVIRRRTVKVQGVIETFLRQAGWTNEIHLRQIVDGWESIVGKFTAAQSIPISLSGGILLVEVGHPLYKTQLSAMKIDILTKLQKENENLHTGIQGPSKGCKITDMRFRLNPNISKLKPTKNTVKSNSGISERVSKPVPPEMKAQIEDAVSAVNDSELQAALKTLFLTQSSYIETAE